MQLYISELQEHPVFAGGLTICKVGKTNGVKVGSGVHVGARVGGGSDVTVSVGTNTGLEIDVVVARIAGEGSVFIKTGVGVLELSVVGLSNK